MKTIYKSRKCQNGSSFEISGYIWSHLTRPCIYIWWRGEQCLYVGMSDNGLLRVLSPTHHVIDKKDVVKSTDRFEIIYPEIAVDTSIELWELYFIDLFKPAYNTVKNYETKFGEEGVRKPLVQKAIPTKEELAEILFPDMPNGLLLANSPSCKSKSPEELMDYLLELRRDRKLLIQLQKLNEKPKEIVPSTEELTPQQNELLEYLKSFDFSKP